MKILTTPQEMRAWSRAQICNGASIGFVPTMGALHDGHLALARRAREENDVFAASVFVNPTQFGAGEDYATYARPFQDDCEMLRQNGCDALFAPSVAAMYPHLDTTSSTRSEVENTTRHHHEAQTVVEVQRLGEVWEGTVRPGHLRGVATVVAMLFNIVQPTRAYFGEKDYQQLKVVEHMARDLCMGTEIVPCATVREPDGLALSSRNVNLSSDERRAASVLYRAMKSAVEAAQNGERDVTKLGEIMCGEMSQEPLSTVQYIAVVEAETLDLVSLLDGREARILIAARVGRTRLIDNMMIR